MSIAPDNPSTAYKVFTTKKKNVIKIEMVSIITFYDNQKQFFVGGIYFYYHRRVEKTSQSRSKGRTEKARLLVSAVI